ncbi:MAG: Ig-like domain-containing protein, partial [Gammaproteobacteria bacterium]|nr:Ig-like domain-containing protein [Gammaproteobacteria bacterium]
NDWISFNDYSVGSYDLNQDTPGGYSIEDSGATLHITGNHWKQIAYTYTVTANTVLEFDFKSPVGGEMHVIGFDNSASSLSDTNGFQLYGTQVYPNWGIQDFHDYGGYAPGWNHYTIPVGQYYTGAFSYLCFGNDDDASDAGEGYFRDVTVYDGEDSLSPTVDSFSPADNAAGVAVNTNLVIDFSENVQEGTGNIVIKQTSDGSIVETISVSSGQVTVSGDIVTIDPSLDLALATGYYVQIDGGAFSDLAGNAYVGISDPSTWDFTTASTSDWISFNDYSVGSYDLNQDTPGGYSIEDSGATLHITRHHRTQIASRHPVTANA